MSVPRNTSCLLVSLAAALSVISCVADVPRTAATGDAALIENAMSAAPDHIARAATIVVRGTAKQMRTLRQGTNHYTCMPDNPRMPGNMPMCIDEAGRAWSQALREHREPSRDAPLSVAYLLAGSSFPSYDDPYATAPPAGAKWVETGPILMIMNVRGALAGYTGESRDSAAPFVMYQGTPYEHLMIPVRATEKATL